MSKLGSAALVLALMLPSPAASLATKTSQSKDAEYTRQVERQLDEVARALGEAYRAIDEIQIDRRPQAVLAAHKVRLEAGRRYLVRAACDSDCLNIDVGIFDPDDRRVVVDIGPDADPQVEFDADAGGEWTVTIMMPECYGEVCTYGFRIWERR